MLDAAQTAHYHREGYVLVRGLLPAADCARWRAAALAAAAPADGGSWTPVTFDHERPDERREVHGALVHDRVQAAVGQLLGPGAQVWYGMAAVVPGHGGRGLPWHQDNQYTHILHHALNTFVALDDIAPEMATLWVDPRSHRRGRLPSRDRGDGHREATVEPEAPLRLPALEAGDACIFHRDTLHRSLVNATDRHRVAYAAQYVEAAGVFAETGEPIGRIAAADLARRWARAGSAAVG